MTLRPQRVADLRREIEAALGSLGATVDDRAHDGWMDPAALATALAADEPVLIRVTGPSREGGQDRFSPEPSEPWWLRHEGASPALRLASYRRAGAHEVEARGLRLEALPELCCDAPKCEAEKVVAQLWLELDAQGELPNEVLLAEQLGEDTAVARLGALGAAAAARFGVPLAYEGALAELGRGREPLSAGALARWMIRREGEHFVLRDYAQRGPREAVGRETVILALMGVGFAVAWYGAYTSAVAEAWTQAAIFGATGLVMTFFVITMLQILRHSRAYRGDSEALLWLTRDLVVFAPWHDRRGAIDLGSAGRYGAALSLGEVERLRVERVGAGYALRCDTAHGPYQAGVLEEEAQAEAWLATLLAFSGAASHDPRAAGRLSGAALAAALVASLVALAGCRPELPPAEVDGPATAVAPPATVAPPAPALEEATSARLPVSPKHAVIADDMPRALAEAREDDRLVFVEVWAPWCHTCLSMKAFVLPDPALDPLRGAFVFAEVDSDRPENAAFMERYEVNVWPTLFALAPDGEVLGLWQGAASVGELRDFLEDALDQRQSTVAPDGAVAALRAGKKAQAAGSWAEAATAYQLALDRGGESWPRRSEAIAGLLFVEHRQGHVERCASLGADHLASLEGAAIPADASYVVLRCAEKVKAAPLRKRAEAAAEARLQRHVDAPPASASVDDESDALAIYAEHLLARGDKARAVALRRRQIELLEAAAAAAPGPREASTFDYARMGAYLAVGEGERAVTLLRQRREELPDSYEPAARLAQALTALGRLGEAREPLEAAVRASYGPRKLGYLARQAELCDKIGDAAGAKEARRAWLALYDSLGEAQRRSHDELAARIRRTLGAGS
ncbi:MAG: thioredoxin family protein [Polyangiaceae bacterium]